LLVLDTTWQQARREYQFLVYTLPKIRRAGNCQAAGFSPGQNAGILPGHLSRYYDGERNTYDWSGRFDPEFTGRSFSGRL